jgi:hypothetical protein
MNPTILFIVIQFVIITGIRGEPHAPAEAFRINLGMGPITLTNFK